MFGSRKVVNLLEILRSYSQVYARFCCMIGGQITSLLSCASNSAEFAASLLVVRAQLEALRPEASQAGLRLTLREMERISSILDNEFLCRPSTLRDWLLNLQSRLEDELAERVFLQVSPERAERFDHPTRGGKILFPDFLLLSAMLRKCPNALHSLGIHHVSFTVCR